MDKRHFLATATAAGMLPLTPLASAQVSKSGPTLLTVGGLVTKTNRGPVDPALDQMMAKHGVKFAKALALDSDRLRRMPRVEIQPTIEYDNNKHKLSGPLLTTVLGEAGVDIKSPARIGLRAVDGYNVSIGLAEVQSYRMIVATHLYDQPLALGGLGPQWAVYEADVLPAFKDKAVKERFALCPWGLYYIDVAAPA
jgi:hypothetical protein